MKKSLLFGIIIMMAMVLGAQENEQQGAGDLNIMSMSTETWGGVTEMRLKFKKEGKLYEMKLRDSKITEMFIDEKKVQESEFSKYDAMVSELLKEFEERRKKAAIEREKARLQREEGRKQREQASQARRQAMMERTQQQREERRTAQMERQRANRERGLFGRKEANEARMRSNREREQAQQYREQAGAERRMMDKLIDDLQWEDIIDDKEDLKSLLLDKDELTVNGKKQSKSLQKKFKEKYLDGGREKIEFRD